ncbi:Hypothetical predicted protein [Pelobates cultripes]|uniref:Uncharacterized protein n=1 Tax=Pelobates cultripes TaxID=61616 RepID=A0AAD1RFW2_PELCU|nr:Hypothetical predicted protein [Pelobates cultripes]
MAFFCSTLHATGPKRPPNQTNGTITALANPAPVPEPQKEAAVVTFQSPASVSPNISCSNREDLSPGCVIASNGTMVRRDLNAFEQALKARAASPSRLLASTSFSKNHNRQNVPTLSDPDDSDAYRDMASLFEPKLDHLYNEQSSSSKAPKSTEPFTIKAGLINKTNEPILQKKAKSVYCNATNSKLSADLTSSHPFSIIRREDLELFRISYTYQR